MTMTHYFQILNDLKKDGLLFGPDPQHMDLLGAKSILYDLRESSMGVPDVLWHKLDDMKNHPDKEFDRILPANGPPRYRSINSFDFTLPGADDLVVEKRRKSDIAITIASWKSMSTTIRS